MYNFSFKKIQKEDLFFLSEIRNECAGEYLHDSRTFTYLETIEWFEKTNPNYYIIFYDNLKIGYFRLSSYSPINQTIYIGMDLHKNWRGKKLAFPAYKQFIELITTEYNLRKIYLEVLSTNIIAKNLYKKLGFQIESIKHEDVIKNGKVVDSEIMSLFVGKKIKKTCLIINFYFNERRNSCKKFKIDNLILLKTQIEKLKNLEHNLSKIIIYCNITDNDVPLINQIIKLVPTRIRTTSIDIRFRDNKKGGYSYGSFSDACTEYLDDFDYFIFLEDDYFIVENNFDSILIKIYESYFNCGYLCAIKYEGLEMPKHASNSFGIASKNSIKKVIERFSKIPYIDSQTTYDSSEKSQIGFSNAFIEVGLEIYDLRNYYKTFHSCGTIPDVDFYEFFNWNSKSIVLPDKIVIDNKNTFISFFNSDKQYYYKYF